MSGFKNQSRSRIALSLAPFLLLALFCVLTFQFIEGGAAGLTSEGVEEIRVDEEHGSAAIESSNPASGLRESVEELTERDTVAASERVRFQVFASHSLEPTPIAGAEVVIQIDGHSGSIASEANEAGIVDVEFPLEAVQFSAQARYGAAEGRLEIMQLSKAVARGVVPLQIDIKGRLRIFLSESAFDTLSAVSVSTTLPNSRQVPLSERSLRIESAEHDVSIPIGYIEVPALTDLVVFGREGRDGMPIRLLGGSVPAISPGEERDVWLDLDPDSTHLLSLQIRADPLFSSDRAGIAHSMFTVWALGIHGNAISRQDVRGYPPFEVELALDKLRVASFVVTSQVYAPTRVPLGSLTGAQSSLVCTLGKSAQLVAEALTPDLEKALMGARAASRVTGLDHWNPILLEPQESGGIEIHGLGSLVEWVQVGRQIFPIDLADGESARLVWPPPGLIRLASKSARLVLEGTQETTEIWLSCLANGSVYASYPVTLWPELPGGRVEASVQLMVPDGDEVLDIRVSSLDPKVSLRTDRVEYEGYRNDSLVIYVRSGQ